MTQIQLFILINTILNPQIIYPTNCVYGFYLIEKPIVFTLHK